MIRVLIAEDEKPARDKLVRWLAEVPDILIVAQCASGVEAAGAIAEARPDVAFMDIQMPGMSGVEVVAQLDSQNAPLVVFVTAYDEYAIRAFELNAIDYLLKPYDKERLLESIARLRERVADKSHRGSAISIARSYPGAADRLLVPEGEALKLIDVSTIESLEADDNYVHVHTSGKGYLLRRTLQDLLAQLGEQQFVRIHKSAAVNVSAIQSLTPLFKGDYDVKLASGREVRMSRRYKDALFTRFGR